MKTILSLRRRRYLAGFSSFLIVAALITGMAGCGGSTAAIEIQDWYGLNATRDSLANNYILMNDLDSTTAGYEELAGPNANGGAGWEPIGRMEWGRLPFTGAFDGQGYEIRDLFINRADEAWDVGLFGAVSKLARTGTIKNVGAVNFTIVGGERRTGGLVGILTLGVVSNCYCTGDITGDQDVGGLVGVNDGGTVSNCYATASVSGNDYVGGLVGSMIDDGTVSNCWATGSVTGYGECAGGLVGYNNGAVSDSYSTATVTGTDYVGGLMGANDGGTVSNSHSTGSVTGDANVGGLMGYNDGAVSNSYATGSNVTGNGSVGGLVGSNWDGTVSNSYSTSSVTGDADVGGLVGWNAGDVSNSYSTGNVTGYETVGGLVGDNYWGAVSNSFWDTETSGQATSDGGTGKTTAEMQDIATFSDTETEGLDEPWDITAVANPSTRNTGYIWNIVDDVTYPFLSWQPV